MMSIENPWSWEKMFSTSSLLLLPSPNFDRTLSLVQISVPHVFGSFIFVLRTLSCKIDWHYRACIRACHIVSNVAYYPSRQIHVTSFCHMMSSFCLSGLFYRYSDIHTAVHDLMEPKKTVPTRQLCIELWQALSELVYYLCTGFALHARLQQVLVKKWTVVMLKIEATKSSKFTWQSAPSMVLLRFSNSLAVRYSTSCVS